MATITEALNVAMQHHQAGELAQAEEIYRLVLQADPSDANALAMLGVVCHQKGQHQEAVDWLRKAVALFPHSSVYHTNLAAACAALGRWDEAAASYAEVVRTRPDSAQDRNKLGDALRQLGRLAEAEACFREALRLKPEYPEALTNLGAALADQGRLGDALEKYREAMRLRPDLPEAHHNLGIVFSAMNKPDEALVCFEQALRLQPGSALILNSLGSVHRDQGRAEKAISCYRMAVAANPELDFIYSNLLLALHYSAGYDPELALVEHVNWGKRFGEKPAAHQPHQPLNRDPDRRLRLGYVSGDFREHVQGRYIEPVIKAHDRERVEVFCYSNVGSPDARTERIKTSADAWRSTFGLSDAQAADLIRKDQIDVLVDLAGHTGGNRLGVFAKKPAPIQATICGYPSTTGLAAMDYRITDPHGDPPGQTERYHVEKLIRVPKAQWVCQPPLAPDVGPLPAQAPEQVTFGSFNSLSKVTDEMIGRWSQILKELPGAKLLIVSGAGKRGDERVRNTFDTYGISKERVELVERAPSTEDYFRLYHRVDICLDTHPYSGCNSTADALWMGVPVITLATKAFVSRQGVAPLTFVGLGDLVAETAPAYIEAATRLARDLPRLRELRGQLRERLRSSPICDPTGFTRDLEAVYREMWQQLCRQENQSAAI
jgi:predicted O-linked N-acetylglucosamine transferase (SPINDLY family)